MNFKKCRRVWMVVSRMLTFSLGLTVLFLCVSCGNQRETPSNSDTSETVEGTTDSENLSEELTEPQVNKLPLVEDGKALYTVVYPEKASEWAQKSVEDLCERLSVLTGVKFVSKNDSEEAATPEILVGKTNRAASQNALSADVTVYDYVIRMSENNVVIQGGCDYSLRQSLTRFLALVEENDNALPENLEVLEKAERSPYLVAITNQKASKIEVFDIGTGVLNRDSRVWQYYLSQYNIAGIKVRNYKGAPVVLATFGNSDAIMISYDTKEALWGVGDTAYNPHSIELIPLSDGTYVIAVASSGGNAVHLYDLGGTASREVAFKFEYADAHGVLWDPDGECLWVWGTNQLTKYRIARENGNVSAVSLAAYTSPTAGGHDLAPVYGDHNLLWVSSYNTVYQFDKTTGTFSTAFDGDAYMQRTDVKGLGNFSDGSLVWIIPDGAFKSWTSATFSFGKCFVPGESYELNLITSDTGHFYKVRVFSTDYQ